MKNLKLRLIVMNFLEFAVWGAYLTCMGNYLGKAGMGANIALFYALQGIVSIFMPTIMGIVADKWIQPQRLLGICHLLAGVSMIGLWWMGAQSATPDPTAFITLYTVSVAFYMPTLALSNTTAFTILKDNGMDTVKNFPPIRVFGTIGFICSMWAVLRDREDVVVFGRRLDMGTRNRAFVIFTAGVMWVLFASFAISCSDHDVHYIQGIIFEVISAFGTVGMSLGITNQWSDVGKLILCLTMFIGRVGLLTLLLSMTKQRKTKLRYPQEDIMIG